MNHRTANVARTPSIKWELNSNWLTAGKECGSILSSRLLGGAFGDDTENGRVADYLIIGNKRYVKLTRIVKLRVNLSLVNFVER